jgi:hypothetical protein
MYQENTAFSSKTPFLLKKQASLLLLVCLSLTEKTKEREK